MVQEKCGRQTGMFVRRTWATGAVRYLGGCPYKNEYHLTCSSGALHNRAVQTTQKISLTTSTKTAPKTVDMHRHVKTEEIRNTSLYLCARKTALVILKKQGVNNEEGFISTLQFFWCVGP